eukprot:scaffold11849_cov66-Phaeocystis_antarctica.AAC.9
MRDPGHGASRVRQRPVGQRASRASPDVVDKPPPPNIPTGPSPPVRRVVTVNLGFVRYTPSVFGTRFRGADVQNPAQTMSNSFLAAAAERTAEADSELAELQRGTWATDRVG